MGLIDKTRKAQLGKDKGGERPPWMGVFLGVSWALAFIGCNSNSSSFLMTAFEDVPCLALHDVCWPGMMRPGDVEMAPAEGAPAAAKGPKSGAAPSLQS